MGRYRWRDHDPLEATKAEQAAFDRLPPSVRRWIREAPLEVSARKALAAYIRERHNENTKPAQAAIARLNEWLTKELEKQCPR
jgi:hypothetical protein